MNSKSKNKNKIGDRIEDGDYVLFVPSTRRLEEEVFKPFTNIPNMASLPGNIVGIILNEKEDRIEIGFDKENKLHEVSTALGLEIYNCLLRYGDSKTEEEKKTLLRREVFNHHPYTISEKLPFIQGDKEMTELEYNLNFVDPVGKVGRNILKTYTIAANFIKGKMKSAFIDMVPEEDFDVYDFRTGKSELLVSIKIEDFAYTSKFLDEIISRIITDYHLNKVINRIQIRVQDESPFEANRVMVYRGSFSSYEASTLLRHSKMNIALFQTSTLGITTEFNRDLIQMYFEGNTEKDFYIQITKDKMDFQLIQAYHWAKRLKNREMLNMFLLDEDIVMGKMTQIETDRMMNKSNIAVDVTTEDVQEASQMKDENVVEEFENYDAFDNIQEKDVDVVWDEKRRLIRELSQQELVKLARLPVEVIVSKHIIGDGLHEDELINNKKLENTPMFIPIRTVEEMLEMHTEHLNDISVIQITGQETEIYKTIKTAIHVGFKRGVEMEEEITNISAFLNSTGSTLDKYLSHVSRTAGEITAKIGEGIDYQEILTVRQDLSEISEELLKLASPAYTEGIIINNIRTDQISKIKEIVPDSRHILTDKGEVIEVSSGAVQHMTVDSKELIDMAVITTFNANVKHFIKVYKEVVANNLDSEEVIKKLSDTCTSIFVDGK